MSNSTGNLHTHMVSYALEELIIKLLIKWDTKCLENYFGRKMYKTCFKMIKLL
jgi:hypothetical protein